MRKIFVENGAILAKDVEELDTNALNASLRPALVLPSVWMTRNDIKLPDLPSKTALVTEWWVERCLLFKTLIEPEDDICSRSLLSLPIDCGSSRYVKGPGNGLDAYTLQASLALP